MAPVDEGMTETPESDSQKMALLDRSLSLIDNGSGHVDDDDDFEPMNEELAIVVRQPCHYVPLRIVRPDNVENGQQRRPGPRHKKRANKTRTKKTSSGVSKTYQRKIGRPSGLKSAKSKTEQKPALSDSSSGSTSCRKGDNDDDFEPPTPMRKRARPSGFKSGKSKTEQKPAIFDSSSGSSGYSKGDKDYDFEPPTPTRKRGRPARSKSANSRKQKDDDFVPEVFDDDDGRKKYACVKGTALDRAVELQKKLTAGGPTFVKDMKHSHVVKGFWLGLPAWFCRNHLPEHDVEIALEDEKGHIMYANYLDYKKGLSGGWQGFAKEHHLDIGDVIVVQLVRPNTFKVYIVRENKFTTTDTPMENNTSKKEKEISDEDTKSKEEEPEVVTRVRSEEAAGGGIRSPGADTGDFVAVKRLVNFKIVVGDGSVVGRRILPDGLRRSYYNICLARKAFLHRNLLKQISPMLSTAVIVETAIIAEEIRASSAASFEDLVAWKKTLESFEPLGMDVSLLLKRVDDLVGLLNAPSTAWMSVPNDALEGMDVEIKKMVEASAKEEKDKAVGKLAVAPW